MKRDEPPSPVPSPPVNRRRFFGALVAAAAGVGAAIVVVDAPAPPRPRRTWKGKTRWIGHC